MKIGTALILALLSTGIVRADTKIVSTLTKTGPVAVGKSGTPKNEKPVETIFYYKGERQRTETAGIVTLYDGASDTLYTLNPKTRTYKVVIRKDAPSAIPASLSAMLDIKTTATVKPTDETKIIAGKTARKFLFTSVSTTNLKGTEPNQGVSLPTYTVEGEQWTTEIAGIPSPVQQFQRAMMLENLRNVIPGTLKPLLEQLATVKGLPLYNKLTVKVSGGPVKDQEPTITTLETQEVIEGSLPDSLFTIPEGYTEEKKPTTPTVF